MSSKVDVVSSFGVNVFNDKAMKEYLSHEAYEALRKAREEHREIDHSFADDIASGMLSWALDKGATHFTHWFQPLNGLSAEKHDAFIGKVKEDGSISYDFKGDELIKGEPDASSFPSGGLRATFEARGYTSWDAGSNVFVIDEDDGGVLYIPTAFCSYNGEALDGKTPLLRSEEALSLSATKLLHLLGEKEARRVISYAGAEQEYFLLEKEGYEKRKDLVYTGRTLFGASAPKGQELDDHYFGPIREKISSYMKEVNETLWKLGVPAKTEHNEVAQSQHELASIYGPSSLSCDQNQLVMMMLKRIAKRHGLICLLSEKPFEGINGSGKHNNFSLGTDTGKNLLSKGDDPENNLVFLAFLASFIKGIDEHADLLRESVASYGNDYRLGGNEAPPAIVSIYLGERLTTLLENIGESKGNGDKKKKAAIVSSVNLPTLYKDDEDRNRTSPFAFTTNRFEFRMVGSEQSIAEPNTYLNAILTESIDEIASLLEKSEDKEKTVKDWVKKVYKEHSRVIFNGNGYSSSWEEEASRRGLPNLKTTPEAIGALKRKENRDLLISLGILSEKEIDSRIAIKYQDYYAKAVIEAKTMARMSHKLYLPAISSALKENNELLSYYDGSLAPVKATKAKLERLLSEAYEATEKLDELIVKDKEESKSEEERALFASKELKEEMNRLRKAIDEAELVVSKKLWPVPTYGDLLFH